MNENVSHSEIIGTQLKPKLQEHKEYFDTEYQKQRQGLKARNAMATVPADSEKIAEDLKLALSPESKAYEKTLERLKNSSNQEMPADEIMQLISGTKADLRDLYKKTASGNHPDVQKDAREKIGKVNKRLDELNNSLKSVMTDNEYKNYNQLNTDYKNQMIPLYKDPHYHQIMNEELSNDDVMKYLRGSDKANKVIKNIIKSDPNIVRNVIGQKFAKKPEDLFHADDLTESYLKHDPELVEKLNAHREMKHNIDLNQQNIKNAEEQVSKSQENAGFRIEDRKKAKEIQDAFQEVKRLQEEKNKLALGQKTLQEKESAQKALNNKTKEIDAARKKLSGLTNLLKFATMAKYLGVEKAIEVIMALKVFKKK